MQLARRGRAFPAIAIPKQQGRRRGRRDGRGRGRKARRSDRRVVRSGVGSYRENGPAIVDARGRKAVSSRIIADSKARRSSLRSMGGAGRLESSNDIPANTPISRRCHAVHSIHARFSRDSARSCCSHSRWGHRSRRCRAERTCAERDESGADLRQRDGAGRSRVSGPSTWIRQELWVETNFDSDRDGKTGSRARRRHASGADRHRRAQGPGALRIEPVLRRHGARPGELERAAGAERQPQPRGTMAQPIVSGGPIADLECAGQRVGAARLRRRALRGAGHRPVAGMSDRRRRSRAHADEVRRRLAERPREGIHDADRQRGGQGDVVVDRQSRHDRHVVRRHAAARRGDDRREGTRGRRAGVAEHVVLPLLPLERTRALARRLPRRRRRRALRLHRQRRHARAARTANASGRTASSPARRDRIARRGDYNDFWAQARSAAVS